MYLEGVSEELAGNGLRKVLVLRPAGRHNRAPFHILHRQQNLAAACVVCRMTHMSVIKVSSRCCRLVDPELTSLGIVI